MTIFTVCWESFTSGSTSYLDSLVPFFFSQSDCLPLAAAVCVSCSCSVLEGKLAEARSKKDTLKARAASAKTSKQVQEMMGSLNTSNAVVAFDKMEEKVGGLSRCCMSGAALAPSCCNVVDRVMLGQQAFCQRSWSGAGMGVAQCTPGRRMAPGCCTLPVTYLCPGPIALGLLSTSPHTVHSSCRLEAPTTALHLLSCAAGCLRVCVPVFPAGHGYGG